MTEDLRFDPICGMWLKPDQIHATFHYIGRDYWFCDAECRDLFAGAPETHVVRLAHEPRLSIAHRCPILRRDATGSTDKDL